MISTNPTRAWPFVPVALVAVATLFATLAACTGESTADNGPVVSINTPTALPTPSPVPSPSPEPTVEPDGDVSSASPTNALSCADRAPLQRDLEETIRDAMIGYDGQWGFALIDIVCDASAIVNEDYFEYAASAGKIVTLVAALEAVESGELEDWELESLDLSLRQVLRTSSDWDADLLEGYFPTSRLDELLREANLGDRSYMRNSWKFSMMTPIDLATFWAAILKGDLLDNDSTAYLLDLASQAEIPPEYETFPGSNFELEGFQYGQKAGYYVEDGVPYFFVGAGYIREMQGDEAFAVALLIRTENPELFDPQRRTVFPLVVEHILAVTGRG